MVSSSRRMERSGQKILRVSTNNSVQTENIALMDLGIRSIDMAVGPAPGDRTGSAVRQATIGKGPADR
jgi:hypothetical protein